MSVFPEPDGPTISVDAPAAEGIDLRVVVPGRLMLQFTWTGLDQLLAAYPA
jgi:hypothetical protein